MNDDEIEFVQIRVQEAMAAEFRWGVTVGAVVGFVLGIVFGGYWQ